MIGEQYRQLTAQRETRQTLERIDGGRRPGGVSLGGRARRRRDVPTCCAAIRSEHGPVRGLVHGAGVLADAFIADKTEEQFDRVYGTKVAGLRNVLAALAPDELRALVLFSSSTGRFGRTGQVDYAIANEVLNKTAQRYARLLPRCRVVSVNWGPWDGGMVTPALKKLFDQEGVGLIGLETGAEYLVQELRPIGGPGRRGRGAGGRHARRPIACRKRQPRRVRSARHAGRRPAAWRRRSSACWTWRNIRCWSRTYWTAGRCCRWR